VGRSAFLRPIAEMTPFVTCARRIGTGRIITTIVDADP
jgi:hypothetical protein